LRRHGGVPSTAKDHNQRHTDSIVDKAVAKEIHWSLRLDEATTQCSIMRIVIIVFMVVHHPKIILFKPGIRDRETIL
jgi:hypothetical protein